MHRVKFWKFGKWMGVAVGVGAVTAAAVTMSPVKLSASSWSPSAPANLPEGAFPKWDYNWDKREPYSLVKPPKRGKGGEGEEEEKVTEQLEKKKCRAIRHVILIRHGQYNLKGASDAERVLTPLGEEQAAITGKRLKNSGVSFTSLIASNMVRALQTAEIIVKNMCQEGLEISCRDPLLREGAPCLPEPPVSGWHPDLHYYEDGARIEAAFRRHFHRADPDQQEDSYEIIVCHANVIRYFVCRAMQFPPEAWLRISLNHTSLTMLSILPSGRVILRSLGDSGHLPPTKMTTS